MSSSCDRNSNKASQVLVLSLWEGSLSMASSTTLKFPSKISGYGNGFVLKASRSSFQKFLLSEGTLGVYMFKIVSMRFACQGMETRRARPEIISCMIVPRCIDKSLFRTKVTLAACWLLP